MEVNDNKSSMDDKKIEMAEHETLPDSNAQDESAGSSNDIMTSSTSNISVGSQQGASGSDTDSWTLLDHEEELKDQERLRIELFANQDLAVFARAAVQALELTTALSNETIGTEESNQDTEHIPVSKPETSPDMAKGHITDSDIETIDEIHPEEEDDDDEEEEDTERKDTPPPTWSSLFSPSPSQQEAEEGRESMNTIMSDGIPVVEDCLSPDGSNYIWSREEGIHSEDDESDETDEPFSTIIKTSPKTSIDTVSSELSTSLYSESELPEEFPKIIKGHAYKHKPNSTLNIGLSAVVVLGIAMVLGLGIGHFLGWSERLELQEQYADLREEKLEEMTDNLMSCMTGEEGKGGDDPDLEDRIIKQLNEENNNLKMELAQYKNQLQQQDSGISVEMTAILRERINDLLSANADLEKEVARLRYSHTAMVEAHASKKDLKETETKLTQAKKTLNEITNENHQLKIAIGKARYGTPVVEKPRKQDLENINQLRTENDDLKTQVGKIRYAKSINMKLMEKETENQEDQDINNDADSVLGEESGDEEENLMTDFSNEDLNPGTEVFDDNLEISEMNEAGEEILDVNSFPDEAYDSDEIFVELSGDEAEEDSFFQDYSNTQTSENTDSQLGNNDRYNAEEQSFTPDSLVDEAYVTDETSDEQSWNESGDDECPKKFGDYFQDFSDTMKSSSKKLWDEAKRGAFDGKEVAKIIGSIKDTSKSVLKDMWHSGHDWTETAKDIGKNFDEKLEKVLKKIPEIPNKIGPATKKVVKATKNVVKKLETSVRSNMKNAKEFLKEQLDEDPAIWTKKKAKKIEEGLKNFLQSWDLDNIFSDEVSDEEKRQQENDIRKESHKKYDNPKEKQKEFKKRNEKAFKKDRKSQKYDVKDSNTNEDQDKEDKNTNPNIDNVPVNQRKHNHGKKKEYSSWSSPKVKVDVKQQNKERKLTIDYNDKFDHQYDSGYGDDSSEDEDDDDDEEYVENKKLSHNKTSTPAWMFERAKNREDVRKEEHKSDWIFARANDRKKFHDLNQAEWHSRRSKNKICSEDSEGDESCENIEQLNVASVNHGNIKGRKHTQEKKYVRGETHFDDDADDIILSQHHFSHRKTNKYPSHRTKPKQYKKGVNYKTNWDDDDVILTSFDERKNSKLKHSNHFKRHREFHQQRFAKHHSHHNIKSDDTILKPNFDMHTFLDDFDRH